MRKAQLAATFRAVSPWPGLVRSFAGHRFKRTTSTLRAAPVRTA
jgi:hypothetical protein